MGKPEYSKNLNLIADAVREVIADKQLMNGSPERGIILRGSYARGNPSSESDVDFQVLIDGTLVKDDLFATGNAFGIAIADKLHPMLTVDPTWNIVDISKSDNMEEMLRDAGKVIVIYKFNYTKELLQPVMVKQRVKCDWILA